MALVPVLVCVVAVPAVVAQDAESSGGLLEATVNRYCLGCHNDQARTAA